MRSHTETFVQYNASYPEQQKGRNILIWKKTLLVLMRRECE